MPRRWLALLLATCAAPAAAQSPADAEFFEKNVRPVLVERCVGCHGAEKPKGGLRLDTREMMLQGGDGGKVVVPGDVKKSRLIEAVKHVGDLKMPQAGKLPDREIAALEEWVARGAPWPATVTLAAPNAIAAAAAKHWAFQRVTRPSVPAFRIPNSEFRNPIDAFVLAKLSDSQLSLSPRADHRTLIRRATFDLHGLPPTPEEIDAFLAESEAKPQAAYERLIERLLASPRYGERWGRHWLDVARYADNKGYVFFEDKAYPWAWTYRDYVIGAFNADTPFDRFVQEQLAADQLKLADPKDLAALGFLTVGGHFMNNTHDIIDDRIDVVTRGLMGLTVTCARCHDHKFDPIPAADYYSLYGVFRSAAEPTIPPAWGLPPRTGEQLLYDAELKVREKALIDYVTAKHAGLVGGARSRAGEYLYAAWLARNQPPADDFMLLADVGDLNPSMITRWRQHLDDAKKRKDAVWAVWHALAELPEKDFASTPLAALRQTNRLVKEAFAAPPKSMKDVADRYGKLFAAIDAQWKAASAKGDTKLADADAEQLRAVLYGPLSPADAPLALDWGFLSLFPERATQAEYQRLLKSVEAWLGKGPPRAMALFDSPRPFDPRVFQRGHPGRPGEPVPRQSPKVASPDRKPFATGGRLELAREIASRDNPLTARVFVNRVWMHHFGRPLVNTPGDFGLRSDPPTHPELLDWLAAEFMGPTDLASGRREPAVSDAPEQPAHAGRSPWSVKRLHKLIMLSATYTQSSNSELGMRNAEFKPRLFGISIPHSAFRIPHSSDPENRLLWKQNRRRLEFEPLHDSILAVSGGLTHTLGGPPVTIPGANRRAVYGYVDRLEFPSLLTTFDVPNPAGLTPQRTPTTVAPQALYLMNGPFARSAAKRLAGLPAIQKHKEPAARLDALFALVLGRPPSEEERTLALAFVAKGPDAARWVDLAHGLLLTNEFAFVD